MARRILTLVAAALFLVTAACGTTDDEKTGDTTAPKKDDTASSEESGEQDDPSSTTETTEEEDGGETPTGDNPEFCAAVAELATLTNDLIERDYEGYIQTIKDADDVFEAYVDGLPEDLKDDGQLLVDAVKQTAADLDEIKGDPEIDTKAETLFEAFETPELEAASEATTEYEEATCPEESEGN